MGSSPSYTPRLKHFYHSIGVVQSGKLNIAVHLEQGLLANILLDSAIWDPTVTKATCFDYNKAAMGYAILNVFTDVATVIIPVPLLWQLNLPRSRKLQVIGIFMTGGLYAAWSNYCNDTIC